MQNKKSLSTSEEPKETSEASEFAKQAEQADIGLVREFVEFLRDNKKWWLSPLIVALLLLGLISLLAAGGAAPFIYTLF